MGLDFISINDPNLEHTIRISKKKKTKGIDMKSKLIGGLKKIFLPKKRRRESKNVSEIEEIFTKKRLFSYFQISMNVWI